MATTATQTEARQNAQAYLDVCAVTFLCLSSLQQRMSAILWRTAESLIPWIQYFHAS